MSRNESMWLDQQRWRTVVVAFSVDGQPIPFKRAGRNGNRSFTPAVVADWQRSIAWAARGVCPEPLVGDVCLRLHFRRKDKRRADLDNMVKSVADAMNGIAYLDDAQIVRLIASVEYGSKAPGVDVHLEAA